jgi:hypothetical protein
MASIVDHIDFQTLLDTASVEQQTFGTQILLVDDVQIPADTRFTFVTKDDFKDSLTSGTVPYDYANVFFQQDAIAERLMLGRWISGDSAPSFICGPGYELDYTVWAAETTGSFAVTDGTNTDDITALSFVGVTALEQIIPILNAGLAAVGAPTVTGLNTFLFSFDSLGRLVLTSSVTGAAADTISITTAGAGSDISVPLMDAPNGTSTSGIDAEAPEDALQIIQALNGGNVFYNINERGCNDAQQLSLAAWIATEEKLGDIVVSDTDAKNPLITTDVGSQLNALNNKRVNVIYHEDTTAYPDAAAAGRFLPEEEGAFQYSWQSLNAVPKSGLTDPLPKSDRDVLTSKSYSYIEVVGGVTYLYDGVTSGGDTKRIMLGRDWFVARNREGIFNYQIKVKLAAFDNPTLTAIEGIIRSNGDEAIRRGILVDTPERPWTVTFPDADDIPAAERATHKLTVFDAFQGYLNIEIHDYKIVGTWSL